MTTNETQTPESYDFHQSQPFSDPRNVTVGSARVIWAKACGREPEGYVLPGGARTTNRMTAQHAAELMNRMMLGGLQK